MGRHDVMHRVASKLLHGPFSRAHAVALGTPARVLEGVQFRRLHQGVYVHRSHTMTWTNHVEAARLALPLPARTTGATRLREAGFDVGRAWALHFVVEGDLHLTLDGVFLHRTAKMPPGGEGAVSIEAAFVAFCAESRLLDAITVGSVLLNEELLDLARLDEILLEEKWRHGVRETAFALPHVEGRCRSMPEAALFSYVVFAGLPAPEVNEQSRSAASRSRPTCGSRTIASWRSTKAATTRRIGPSTTLTSTGVRSTAGTTCPTS